MNICNKPITAPDKIPEKSTVSKYINDEQGKTTYLAKLSKRNCRRPFLLRAELYTAKFLPRSRIDFKVQTKNNSPIEVLYFAGCMTHLVPGIKKAMTTILYHSGYTWRMLDADEEICCGRPLLLAGQITAANKVIMHTRSLIENSHAQLLVTSCPICFKTFSENCRLPIPVLHHTQFINMLQQEHRIPTYRMNITVKYHDPCELGRGMHVYEELRVVINRITHLQANIHERKKSLCCGDSLGNTFIDFETKQKVAADTLQQINIQPAECLVTTCPLCQKKFST